MQQVGKQFCTVNFRSMENYCFGSIFGIGGVQCVIPEGDWWYRKCCLVKDVLVVIVEH